MSVRKRTWKNAAGEPQEAYVVDYVDQLGKRHIETFARKKDADARHAEVKVSVAKGTHTPINKSITVAQAATEWLSYLEGEGRERTTLECYRSHVIHHIVPRIGNEKLAKLTTPGINDFRDQLVRELSRVMAQKVLVTFKSILRRARDSGKLAQNVADGVSIKIGQRGEGKLEAGVDIPIAGRDRRDHTGRKRALAAVADSRGLHRAAGQRIAWIEMDRCRSQGRRDQGRPAGRQARPDRAAQVEGRPAHRPDRPVRGEHLEGMAATEPARARVLQRRWQCREPGEHRPARLDPDAYRGRPQRQVWRNARLPAFLCLMVHQPSEGRRP